MSIVIANGKFTFLLHIHLSNLFLHSWGSCPPNTVCMRCVIQLNWKTLFSTILLPVSLRHLADVKQYDQRCIW